MTPALPAGSISIQALATADTIVTAVPVTKDSVFVIGFKAMLQGQPSTVAHHVVFAVDTTQLAGFRAKYGNALLLPAKAYYFYQPDCSIPAGAALSDSAAINIVKGSTLHQLTTYVLPVIIRSVDGQTEGIAAGQVLYLVARTGKSLNSKEDWTIVSYSSDNGAGYGAANVLDNDDQNTVWVTDLYKTMPQYVEIDFGSQLTFSGVTYRAPYYKYGYAYPKQIKIELSTDGTNWTDKGTFGGQTSDATQTIDIGASTARYLRFTVLAAAPLVSYDVVAIGGIGVAL